VTVLIWCGSVRGADHHRRPQANSSGILNAEPAQMMVKPKARVVPGEDHRQGWAASQALPVFGVIFKARRFCGS